MTENAGIFLTGGPMEANNDRLLCAAKVSFVGMILESFSHELKNHLSVIRESNGLMHDIMGVGKMDKEHVGQCREAMRSVDRQIDKSVSLISFFDDFSRGMKFAGEPCGINEAIDILLLLLHRRMSQRKVTIEKSFSNKVRTIPCNPIDLQFVVFCCIEEFMRMLGQGDSIIVKTMSSEEEVTITIMAKSHSTRPVEGGGIFPTLPLQRIVEDMGATLSRHPGHPEIELRIRRQT